mgnify:CR=1 FL=1
MRYDSERRSWKVIARLRLVSQAKGNEIMRYAKLIHFCGDVLLHTYTTHTSIPET